MEANPKSPLDAEAEDEPAPGSALRGDADVDAPTVATMDERMVWSTAVTQP